MGVGRRELRITGVGHEWENRLDLPHQETETSWAKLPCLEGWPKRKTKRAHRSWYHRSSQPSEAVMWQRAILTMMLHKTKKNEISFNAFLFQLR